MILTTYTVKKGLAKKVTIKTPTGGFDSNENSAEVTMTFDSEGKDIDVSKCNEIATNMAEDLLDHKQKDPAWIDEDITKMTPHQQSISGEPVKTEL